VFSCSCEVATAGKHEIEKDKISLFGSGYAGLGFHMSPVFEQLQLRNCSKTEDDVKQNGPFGSDYPK